MSHSFTREEFERRIAAVRARMAAENVDVFVIDESEPMVYLTGHANTLNLYRAVLLPRSGSPIHVLRRLDEAPLREASFVTDIVAFRDWEDQVETIVGVIRERGWAKGRIAFDFNSWATTVKRFQQYQALMPEARFVDLGRCIYEIRLVKSEPEIALMRRACAIADEAMRRAIATVKIGSTERKAAVAASAAFVELGADNGSSGPITSGTGWGFLHGYLHDNALKSGDVVHMELVPRFEGYSARLMRPCVAGVARDEQRRHAEQLIALQDAQIAAMKPGALARDVDAILREGVLAAGLRDSYDNYTGYTLGYYDRAGPRTSDFTRILGPRSEYRLEAGMTFHMWTAAQGLAFSETVLVGANGPERLTKIERKLFENRA
jgi:Xaa-Pro dipeptidase